MKIINCCGDKSISHRAIMLSSIAKGSSHISNFLQSKDCIATLNLFKNLGVNIQVNDSTLLVHGVDKMGLQSPTKPLDCKNSATTIRLVSGILTGQNFGSILYGDISLSERPMKRIITPLTLMNANIFAENYKPPIFIKPSSLKGIDYDTKSSSAQVKSCILLAGLYASSKTSIVEKFPSRNHTEIMLKNFGASINFNNSISIEPTNHLYATSIDIPNDISSAAFFIAYALLKPNMQLKIPRVSMNKTRIGILNVLHKMGADIEYDNFNNINEPFCDIIISSSKNLSAIDIHPNEIGTLIDEIPIISLIMSFADGESNIYGISDLKNKETNRIIAIVDNLRNLGVNITSTDDSIKIIGPFKPRDAKITTYNDHRIAMTFIIAKLLLNTKIYIDNTDCIAISYPNFFDDLKIIKS